MAGIEGSLGALGSGAAQSLQIGDIGMSAIATQNAQSMKDIMLQGMLSALRSFCEALAKTLKAGADAVKGLV